MWFQSFVDVRDYFEVLEYNGAGLCVEKLRHHIYIIDVCTSIAADIIHRVIAYLV